MKTFLLPTNFSFESANALRYAVSLAKEFRSRIIVQHNYPRNSPVHRLSDLELQLHAFVSEYDFECYENSDDYLRIETVVQAGREIDNIIRLIKKQDIDVLILESKEHSIWAGVPFSRLISDILEQTAVSILIVPDGYQTRPFQAITYAMSLDEGDSDIIDSLLLMGAILSARLMCLHVSTTQSDILQSRLDILKEVYASIPAHQLEFKTIENSGIHDGISNFLVENPSELLVLLTRERSFFEGLFHRSVSKHMTFQSHSPVMIVKL